MGLGADSPAGSLAKCKTRDAKRCDFVRLERWGLEIGWEIGNGLEPEGRHARREWRWMGWLGRERWWLLHPERVGNRVSRMHGLWQCGNRVARRRWKIIGCSGTGVGLRRRNGSRLRRHRMHRLCPMTESRVDHHRLGPASDLPDWRPFGLWGDRPEEGNRCGGGKWA